MSLPYLYCRAEDDVKSSKGHDEDSAYEKFMDEHKQTPLRILGVTKEAGNVVEGEVLWEDDELYMDDDSAEGP